MNKFSLRERFQKRELLFGAWTSLAHPQITEMFASIMKPDFLGIDIEHSTISHAESQRIIAAGSAFAAEYYYYDRYKRLGEEDFLTRPKEFEKLYNSAKDYEFAAFTLSGLTVAGLTLTFFF